MSPERGQKLSADTLAWLRDNKVTQNELAEILGMTPQQLNDIVKDRTVRGDFHPVLGTWAMVLLAVLLGILLWNAPTRCRRL